MISITLTPLQVASIRMQETIASLGQTAGLRGRGAMNPDPIPQTDAAIDQRCETRALEAFVAAAGPLIVRWAGPAAPTQNEVGQGLHALWRAITEPSSARLNMSIAQSIAREIMEIEMLWNRESIAVSQIVTRLQGFVGRADSAITFCAEMRRILEKGRRNLDPSDWGEG